MNKEIEKYVWYYLAVYIAVLLVFAAFQYFGECNGASLNCKTNWEKVKDILQTTAYILTPIVAIVALLNWKAQHNKLIFSEEAKPILLKVNDDIRLITRITSLLKDQDSNCKPTKRNYAYILDVNHEIIKNNDDISSKSYVLYNLTQEEQLEIIRLKYNSFMIKYIHDVNIIIQEENTTHGDLLKAYDDQILMFLKINKLYKNKLRKFVLA